MKKSLKVYSVVAIIIVVAIAEKPIPKTKDPMHEGQPAWCNNKSNQGYAANCNCEAKNAEECTQPNPNPYSGMDPKDNHGPMAYRCSTRCQKNKCNCKRYCLPVPETK
jgi:hypothetical protein